MLLPLRNRLRLGMVCGLILMVVGAPISFGFAGAPAGAARPDAAPAAPVATPGLAYKSFIGTDFHRVASDTGFAVASSAQQLVGAQIGYLPPASAANPASASFSGYDFHPRGSASDFASAGAGKVYATSLAAGDAFIVRPNLPQGAQITRMEFD